MKIYLSIFVFLITLSGCEKPDEFISKSPEKTKFSANEFFDFVRNDDYRKVREILSSGFNVNTQDQWGSSALHESIRSYKMCKLLIECKINPNLKKHIEFDGYTALHLACMSECDKGVVELLLQSGADPNIVDAYEKTPLDYANELAASNEVWAIDFKEKVKIIESYKK